MSQKTPEIIKVYCGELCKTNVCSTSTLNLLHKDINGILQNIEVVYSKFVKDPDIISRRVIDLLQIAAYVFCADRMVNRGSRYCRDNDAWARSFEFFIPVYDLEFWNNDKTKTALGNALRFMTGDRKYNFNFKLLKVEVINTGVKQLSFFNNEYLSLDEAESTDILLFSGGLDSLAGAIQRLNEYPNRRLCLVSHRANNAVTHTQSTIIKYLNEKYSNRIRPYGFECHNHKLPSKDETQRTRMFLFSAIAFAISNCYDKHEFFVYENGITSMNLAKQSDIMNARASRTTHPKTLGLLQVFYRLFDTSFRIVAPFHNKTKAEVVDVFNIYKEQNIVPSSVSCSSTRTKPNEGPHCGLCSQCIDRRFAIFASKLEEDNTIYSNDFVREFNDDEVAQRIINTLRLASMEEIKTKYDFLSKYATEIGDLVEYWSEGANPEDQLNEIYALVASYGDSVLRAATKMRSKYDDIRVPVKNNSLLAIIDKRDYLKTIYARKVEEINAVLQSAIPKMFQREKPKSENAFNDKISAILNVQGQYSREYPVLAFGIATFRPDHSQETLLIESKYFRGTSMTPSKASEDIAADITKAPKECGLLFVVYDPERKIADDASFIRSFEEKRSNCFVRIYR